MSFIMTSYLIWKLSSENSIFMYVLISVCKRTSDLKLGVE